MKAKSLKKNMLNNFFKKTSTRIGFLGGNYDNALPVAITCCCIEALLLFASNRK